MMIENGFPIQSYFLLFNAEKYFVIYSSNYATCCACFVTKGISLLLCIELKETCLLYLF